VIAWRTASIRRWRACCAERERAGTRA